MYTYVILQFPWNCHILLFLFEKIRWHGMSRYCMHSHIYAMRACICLATATAHNYSNNNNHKIISVIPNVWSVLQWWWPKNKKQKVKQNKKIIRWTKEKQHFAMLCFISPVIYSVCEYVCADNSATSNSKQIKKQKKEKQWIQKNQLCVVRCSFCLWLLFLLLSLQFGLLCFLLQSYA